jgi:hypothetical protein
LYPEIIEQDLDLYYTVLGIHGTGSSSGNMVRTEKRKTEVGCVLVNAVEARDLGIDVNVDEFRQRVPNWIFGEGMFTNGLQIGDFIAGEYFL